MTEQTTDEVWDRIREEVVANFQKICESVSIILKAHKVLGFQLIAEHMDPSIEDILLSLAMIKASLEPLQSSNLLPFSELRILMNSKQMIWCMESVAQALKAGSQHDYQRAIEMMRQQSRH